MAGYIGSKASVVSSGAERKKTFTITGATTSLTGLNYTVGKVHVFQNGVRLVDGTDYTATNGTTITLTVAAQSGDNVVVISQASFQVADALLTSGGTMTGDLSFADNDKAIFGAGSDLQVYHSGSHSVIKDAGDGNLQLIANDFQLRNGADNANMMTGANGGAITLMHNGSSKLATTSTGIDVTGETSAGSRLVLQNKSTGVEVNSSIRNHTNNYAYMFGGTNGLIFANNTGEDTRIKLQDSNEIEFITSSTNRMVIDSSGRVTKPNQPYFNVQKSSSQNNITAGAYTTVTFGTEHVDTGGNFANNTFTAPVTGVYSLSIGVRLDNVDTSAIYYNFWLHTSNRAYHQLTDVKFTQDSMFIFTMNVIADMDANDTAILQIQQYGGASQTDINPSTFFQGYLLG